jgi:phospholipase/carboxylesterase
MVTTTLRQMGGLTCRIVDAVKGDGPDVVAVFCHGFGAPGDDLVPLAGELLRAQPALRGGTRMIFPQAPLDMAPHGLPGGRAWWPIDMLQLQAAIEFGEFRNLRNECPELLPEARRLLMQLIDEVRAETKLPLSRFVLGGFSQGAMLSTDVTLRLPESTGGLVIWSGTLLCEDQWRPLAPQRGGLPVIQSHGHEDPILPFEAAGWLRDLLIGAGLTVRFLPFHGYHQIPQGAVDAAAELMAVLWR